MNKNYKRTICACFIGYIVQAIVNNFLPLLFVTFQKTYGIPLSKITLLITLNFMIQLFVDAFSAWFIKKAGYKTSIIIAHISAAFGLCLLTFLPEALPDPFLGTLIPVFFYAVGGGLLEVLVSPIVEACPTENKEKTMSLLHSFYCWGHVGVVLISTAFFAVFGMENWKLLALFWAIIPVLNIFVFAKAPIYVLEGDDEKGLSVRELFSKKSFLILIVMMLCAGASEQAVSQWASTFAEQGLGVSKAIGDLAGPMSFAAAMGLSRLIFGKLGDKLNLDRFMIFSCVLCLCSYACIVFVPEPTINLIGCAMTGFSVGIMWPGTYSRASAMIRGGGTSMFALLALAGDLGCSGGPTLAGLVSSAFGGNLKIGILSAMIFPALMLCGIFALKKKCK